MSMSNNENWRIINMPDKSGGIFHRGRKISDLESVAAAVSRCEAILDFIRAEGLFVSDAKLDSVPKRSEGKSAPLADKVSAPLTPTYRAREENKIDSPLGKNSAKDSKSDQQLLLKLMQEEKSLSRYLTATDNDPFRAFAYAKGEVAYLNQLRSSSTLAFSLKAFLDKALLPVLLIVLTAVLGNVVGMVLQSQSFERNRKFDVNLERLREGQRISGNMVVSLRELTPRIERDEQRHDLAWRPQDALKRYKNDMEQIRSVAAGLDAEGDISKALVASDEKLTTYINCLDNIPAGGETSPNNMCSKQFSIDPFLDLEDKFSRALIKFLS